MFRRSFRQTNKVFGSIVADLVVIIFSIFGGVITLRYDSSALNLLKSIDNETIVSALYTAIILIFLYPIIYFLNLLFDPFLQLRRRRFFGKISVKPFAGFKGREKDYAWLLIENNTEADLRDCYLELKSFDRHEESGFLAWKDYVTINTNKFAWPDFQQNDEKIVRRKSSARINVAKLVPNERAIREAEEEYYERTTQEHRLNPRSSRPPIGNSFIRERLTSDFSNGILHLTMEDGNREAFPVRRNFYIEVAFNGRIDETDIPEIVFKGFLIHDRLGDLVEFLLEPGEIVVYETVLKQLIGAGWFDSFDGEEKEYYRKNQWWINWDASRSP
jgi:hypothetical protein